MPAIVRTGWGHERAPLQRLRRPRCRPLRPWTVWCSSPGLLLQLLWTAGAVSKALAAAVEAAAMPAAVWAGAGREEGPAARAGAGDWAGALAATAGTAGAAAEGEGAAEAAAGAAEGSIRVKSFELPRSAMNKTHTVGLCRLAAPAKIEFSMQDAVTGDDRHVRQLLECALHMAGVRM